MRPLRGSACSRSHEHPEVDDTAKEEAQEECRDVHGSGGFQFDEQVVGGSTEDGGEGEQDECLIVGHGSVPQSVEDGGEDRKAGRDTADHQHGEDSDNGVGDVVGCGVGRHCFVP